MAYSFIDFVGLIELINMKLHKIRICSKKHLTAELTENAEKAIIDNLCGELICFSSDQTARVTASYPPEAEHPTPGSLLLLSYLILNDCRRLQTFVRQQGQGRFEHRALFGRLIG